MKPRTGINALLAACLSGAVLAASAPVAAARLAPEPSPVPRSWQLEYKPSDLRVVILDLPDGTAEAYYYLTFMVTNTTGRDLFFAPMFELSTDQGEVLLSGRNVPTEVTRELLRRLNNPLLEDQVSIIGPILQGPENAKEGLVIWPVTNTQVSDVNVYAFGFSGETRTIQLRNFDTGDIEDVVLRKSMMLRHTVIGDLLPGAGTQGGKVLGREETRWILRKPESTIGAADAPVEGASR